MGTRRKSRELAMQMLFQGDLGKQTPEQVAEALLAVRAMRSMPILAVLPRISIGSRLRGSRRSIS